MHIRIKGRYLEHCIPLIKQEKPAVSQRICSLRTCKKNRKRSKTETYKANEAQKELEDKYKSERAEAEQEFADQRRILEEANDNVINVFFIKNFFIRK